jgi:hypothetical protein
VQTQESIPPLSKTTARDLFAVGIKHGSKIDDPP